MGGDPYLAAKKLLMKSTYQITEADRERIEKLIKSFDDHGCGFGFDVQAQDELRLLLDALDEANRVIDMHESRS